jgi:hypothetical protein
MEKKLPVEPYKDAIPIMESHISCILTAIRLSPFVLADLNPNTIIVSIYNQKGVLGRKKIALHFMDVDTLKNNLEFADIWNNISVDVLTLQSSGLNHCILYVQIQTNKRQHRSIWRMIQFDIDELKKQPTIAQNIQCSSSNNNNSSNSSNNMDVNVDGYTGRSMCGREGCPESGLKCCGVCKSVCYCSIQCQKQDWKRRHRQNCNAFKQSRIKNKQM